MAKATAKKAATITKAEVMAQETLPTDLEGLQQVFKVSDSTSDDDIVKADGMPGVRLEFDYVYFRKLSESFVAMLKPHNQKSYWLAYGEWEDRSTRSNRALHEIGVDPITKILDRPRGSSNPIVRDQEKVQKLLGHDWYVTWRVQGGQGDLTNALESGFKIICRPQKGEEKKSPLEWSGEAWKIRDGIRARFQMKFWL